MGQTVSRTEARELAFRLVFGGGYSPEALEIALDGKKICEPEMKFIEKIMNALEKDRAAIDAQIAQHLMGWTIDRINKTDLAVLRLAAAEAAVGEVPKAVIVNECVAIAKKYGADGSGGFVNGVLAKIVG